MGAVLGGAPRDTADALDRAGRLLGEPVGGGPRARKKTFPVPAALGSPTARRLPALIEAAGGVRRPGPRPVPTRPPRGS
ncbi:hypothetical protein [Streptomyces sp. NRRL WC-3744]|uniref:hypothetical protein n=1 Tax=Streptomyces sp. NRRL WC-3744 TaxID=1463935 RepID=UPI0004C752C8